MFFGRIKQKNRHVAIAAGGTGGHFFPAIAVAKKLIENNYRVLFFTDLRCVKYIDKEHQLLESGVFNVVLLGSKNAPRWKQLFMILNDLWKCRIIIKEGIPLCIGFGGLVSFPVVLFSILTMRRTIIHEQNSVIGLANKLLLPFVRLCLTSFEDTKGISKYTKKRKVICVGIPIRDSIKKYIYQYDNPSVNYRVFYKIDEKINLTIFGGSQATDVFDTIIPKAISMLPNDITTKLFVRHQSRPDNHDEVLSSYINEGIACEVKNFFDDAGQIMRESHLVIARSGATTLFEIMALGVPSILIPLPTSANNHQYENAKFLSNKNASILMEQNTLTAEKLAMMLEGLFTHDALLAEMSQCCRKLANVYADIKFLAIIDRCLGYLTDIEIKSPSFNARYINDNVGLG